MIEFIASEHIGHQVWGDVTEVYHASTTLYVEGIGGLNSGEESSRQDFTIQGCYDCDVEFIDEGDE